MDTRALARSTFGTSPAVEVVGVVRSRGRHPLPHVRAWYDAALARVPDQHLEVLHALVPAAWEHPHVPDFLCPAPAGVAEPVDAVVQRIADTPPEVVDYQLDISLDGRPVRPEVAAQWESETAYRGWRRTPPQPLQELVAEGPHAVAERAAEAVAAVFEGALAGPWPEVMAVLEADIAHRGTVVVQEGAEALLTGLGEGFTWTGSEVVLDRPYEGTVDWAEDGMLLVPSTVHTGPVRFAAEQPEPPVVVYAARGVARLWEDTDPAPARALEQLVGATRARVLTLLGEPRTTTELSRRGGWSEATTSYHLGVLLRARLVSRTRRGRAVLYRRTALGEALAEGG
jgi:DNA-binding transcriptional ArsR family regulator